MFCCLVKDRNEIEGNTLFDSWESYINDTAMLLENNIKKLSNCEICILCDDLSKPANISDTFENRLMAAVKKKLVKIGISDCLFGVVRLESHASLMIQLVDILLGSVMFDFKREMGLISEKQFERKNIVVTECRNIIGEILSLIKDNICSRRHTGFNVYCGGRIYPGDAKSMENISRYIIRASFSTERLNYIREDSKVIYKSKNGNDTKEFQSLDFIASLCSHIPNQNEQTVRYLSYYSNVCREKRKRQAMDEPGYVIEDDLHNKSCSKSFSKAY